MRRLAVLGFSLGVGALGCTGSLSADQSVDTTQAGTGVTPGTDPSAAGGSATVVPGVVGAGGSSVTPGTTDALTLLQNPPPDPVAAQITCTNQEVVPRGRIWRLSASAYKNSINDTLGVSTVDLKGAPLDSVTTTTRFSSNAQTQVVDQPWADWYFAQGDKIASQLAGALPATHTCMTMPAASTDCVQSFINDYAGKLFRRPVTPDELTRYQTAYSQWATEMTPTEATKALVQAWTMSPNHVFRSEVGSRALGPVDLTQYEIASEISFMFANTAPDAALLADAQQGKLTDPAVVQAHATRLLMSPSGHEVLKNFFFEFLHLRELDGGGALDPSQQALVPSMEAETGAFVENVIFNQNAGLDTLFSSTKSFVDPALSTFYGLAAAPSGTSNSGMPSSAMSAGGSGGTMPTSLTSVDTGRPGLLHQAAFLNTRRDATRRGLFVRGELLCSPPAPPPPEAVAVAQHLTFDENATARDIYEVIKGAGAVCAACHTTFVPLGLSFEHYDKLGKHRDTDNGKVLDVTGTFPGVGDLTTPFTDSADMLQQIIASNQGQLCFSKRFISYLEGRAAHGVLDGCLISQARTAMVSGQFSLLKFMGALTQDPSFYKRINLEN
ncbi:MAG TPA: DUF1592 domain-containing protein [Polyangiaceae bacterium]|nr:DUF1592 domain-containing protein [Polyangiaceae bacterium]